MGGSVATRDGDESGPLVAQAAHPRTEVIGIPAHLHAGADAVLGKTPEECGDERARTTGARGRVDDEGDALRRA